MDFFSPPPWFNMFIYLRMLITVFWCFFLFPQSSYFCLFCSLSFILVTFCKRLKILRSYLLLLLLSRLSRVWLCATPQMAAHQALPSLGFSRQEHCVKVKSEREVAQSCPRYPGSSVSKETACRCRRPGSNPWVRKIPWRRKWQPTPVFLPGKPHGQRSLVGYSPWGCMSQTQLSA